jgi:hypothetical protein
MGAEPNDYVRRVALTECCAARNDLSEFMQQPLKGALIPLVALTRVSLWSAFGWSGTGDCSHDG